MGSGRNVWWISGRMPKLGSSGCWGAGWETGRYNSKRVWDRGECSYDPTIRETCSGTEAFGVGGIDGGGRLGSSRWKRKESEVFVQKGTELVCPITCSRESKIESHLSQRLLNR